MKQHLILYRNLKYGELLDRMGGLLERYGGAAQETDGQKKPRQETSGQEAAGQEAKRQEAEAEEAWCAGELIALADVYGFEGNLWLCFLALCLAENENPYSIACEIRGEAAGSLNQLALHDFSVFWQLSRQDLGTLPMKEVWSLAADYQGPGKKSRQFDSRVRDRILTLAAELLQAESPEAFRSRTAEFYRELGVGKFGLNQAFRVTGAEGNAQIEPITGVEEVSLKDLVGYERQKKKLIENTEAFIEGREANNVLLFGDSGTGKSSSIKAVLHEYYGRGLRMIEVYKHQFQCLGDILEQVKDRNYKFIIYMDDLSFEEYEIEYKYLKAMIEGGLGRRPDNVLIYATSNRRHLIREKFSDKRELDDDLHQNDTVQEKLSLVARFGVTIYYGAPDKREFQQIVRALASRHNLCMPEEELLLKANQWELSHGGLSGRTASQFITHLLGTEQIQEESYGN